MSKCEHCEEVNQNFRIEHPSDLKSAIRVIADNLADETIVINSDKLMGEFTSVPFAKLVENEQWDDIVEYYFKCPKCNLKFSLTAETYHGSGGSWAPLNESL